MAALASACVDDVGGRGYHSRQNRIGINCVGVMNRERRRYIGANRARLVTAKSACIPVLKLLNEAQNLKRCGTNKGADETLRATNISFGRESLVKGCPGRASRGNY